MSNFPPQLPHGTFNEVLPDIFLLTGMTRIEADNVSEFSRNMVVIRDGDKLTLVNTIRLDAVGLAALDALGNVSAVVRLGGFHGRDDAFYLERYSVPLWAAKGTEFSRGEKADFALSDGGAGPCVGATAFAFNTPKSPEAILHLDRHGGIIVTCDSLQNFEGPDQYFNDFAAAFMTRLGFFEPAVVGPGWKNRAGPELSDFERLLELDFQHLLSAHGAPLLKDAKAAVQGSVAKSFAD